MHLRRHESWCLVRLSYDQSLLRLAPPFCPRTGKSGLVQWWSQPLRICCRHLRLSAQTTAPTLQFLTKSAGACEPHGNHQILLAGLARGFLPGSGTTQLRQTNDYLTSVTPTYPSRPGRRSLILSHWSSRSA